MTFSFADWRSAIELDLATNILPFWRTHTPDLVNGGFVGALTNDLKVRNDVPRSAVVCARILWTYAAAYRLRRDPADLAMAQRALDELTGRFWDPVHQGVVWSIDAQGKPVEPRKHSYAQAFAIYGLSEHHVATGDPRSLQLAQSLHGLLERHAADPVHGGYLEGRSQAWGQLDDMRLSALEPQCHKSMNTLLHILEAYTNLLRVWDDPALRERQRVLLRVFLDRVIDPETHSFRLFFADDWRTLPEHAHVSPGHDIEGSWLLVEAAEVLGDPALLAEVRAVAVRMAEAVLARGRDVEGAIVYAIGHDAIDADRHWWVQAEGVVGFTNAYQLSRDVRFLEAARTCWEIIDRQFIDRRHGEWFKIVSPDGTPRPGQVKTGPWECPYHNARMGFEMTSRLSSMEKLQ